MSVNAPPMAHFSKLEILSFTLSFLDANDYKDGATLFNLLGLTKSEKLQVFTFWIQHSNFSSKTTARSTHFTRNKRLHRSQGPAVLNSGEEKGYRYGLLHRITGPAVLGCYIDGENPRAGRREWYCDGKRHRGGGEPAVVWGNGDQEWFWQGERHREEGPAMITSFPEYVRKIWCCHGNMKKIIYENYRLKSLDEGGMVEPQKIK